MISNTCLRTLLTATSLCIAVSACAPGVTALGQGNYLVSVEGDGLDSFDTLKADGAADASKYCSARGKTARVVSTTETENRQRDVDTTFVCD